MRARTWAYGLAGHDDVVRYLQWPRAWRLDFGLRRWSNASFPYRGSAGRDPNTTMARASFAYDVCEDCGERIEITTDGCGRLVERHECDVEKLVAMAAERFERHAPPRHPGRPRKP